MKYRPAWPCAMPSLVLLAAQAAAQQVPASTPSPLNEVVVVANRTPEPLSRVGSSVTVITHRQIERSQATVVSDLLASTPGITVTRDGGIGEPTSVFIRGAESDQTVLVIDGVKMTDPSLPGGGFDFENLLTGDVSRIEILRGAQSTLYGSDAIGGVINIVTADPTRKSQGSVSLEGGSYGTAYGSAGIGGTERSLQWRLAASYDETAGIACFDRYLGGRRDCASRIGDGAAQARYEITSDIQMDIRGYFVSSRTDFDGYDTPSGAFGDDSEYGKVRQGIGYAGLTWRSPERTLTQTLSVQYTASQTRNYDPNAPVSYGYPTTQTFYGLGRNIREVYQGTWRPSGSGHIVLGLDHEHSTISTFSPFLRYLGAGVSVNSAYAQAQYGLLPGLTLTVGGRYDHHEVYGGHGTGQIAAAWALPGGETILRTSFGQGFKAPALYQLYSNYGNRALRPETASSWDVGLERHLPEIRLIASASYFQRTSNNLVEYFDCSTASPLCATEPLGYYANIARSFARGVELDGSLALTRRLSLSANYSWIATENRSPGASTYGNELPRRPADSANAKVSYRWPFRLDTALGLRYSGPGFDDAANRIRLAGYVLIDLRASLPLNSHVRLYARMENLADRHYEVAYQYGTPGRSAYMGARVSF